MYASGKQIGTLVTMLIPSSVSTMRNVLYPFFYLLRFICQLFALTIQPQEGDAKSLECYPKGPGPDATGSVLSSARSDLGGGFLDLELAHGYNASGQARWARPLPFFIRILPVEAEYRCRFHLFSYWMPAA